MQIETEALVCAARAHGEHGTIVRILTPADGLIAGYVRGGKGRRMRPVIIPGNVVSAQLRSRTEAQLPQMVLELVHSRAPILSEPLPSAAIEWVTALAAAALPERQPYPRIYEAMSGLLDAVEVAPSAIGWSAALARFEQLLAAEIGYGAEDLEPIEAGWQAVVRVLERSSDSLVREVLTDRSGALHDSRLRLLDRLRRAAA
jgi:DNA repair protein RecO (recombination protein O)